MIKLLLHQSTSQGIFIWKKGWNISSHYCPAVSYYHDAYQYSCILYICTICFSSTESLSNSQGCICLADVLCGQTPHLLNRWFTIYYTMSLIWTQGFFLLNPCCASGYVCISKSWDCISVFSRQSVVLIFCGNNGSDSKPSVMSVILYILRNMRENVS